MKIILIVVIFSSAHRLCNAQPGSPIQGCACTLECTPQQLHQLRQGWTDYEAHDLNAAFPLSPGEHQTVIDLKLDAHGCIYPPFLNLISSDNFIDKKIKVTWYVKYSMFNVFQKKGQSIVDDLKRSNYDPRITTELQKLVEIARYVDDDKQFASNVFEFRRRWNALFLPPVIDQINQFAKTNGVKETFWFVPGFNVPYSLAHVQSNAVFRQILQHHSKDHLIFVRVFWPSESAKTLSRNPPCTYKNMFRFQTFTSYKYVANRSYVNGLTLRSIFDKLSPGIDVNLISHSHGAALVTASLLNPMGQMSHKKEMSPLNAALQSEFTANGLNNRLHVRAFMNAPAMPGASTFSSIDKTKNANHYFYVGFNHRDKMLLKKQLVVPLPRKFSSTSLGCDWKGEVQSASNHFSGSLKDHFTPVITGHQREHDFFCYMSKPEFQSFFGRFLNECFSTP